jgi:hypothetical protein
VAPAVSGEGAVAKGSFAARLPTLADLRDLLDRLLGRPLRPRRFEPSCWTAGEVERRIEGEPVEWGYVFDASGAQVVRRRGTRTTISFAGAERLLKDALVIHNHPVRPGDLIETLTFSESDLRFAVEYDVAELRAVVPGWRFGLRRPPDGWPFDEQVMLDEYRRVKPQVDADLGAAVADGRMTYASKVAQERHEGFRRMASAGLLSYQAKRMER